MYRYLVAERMTIDCICCGGLRIDYLITPDGQAHVREMGGNALYAAVGARVWSDRVGLLARVGENYPTGWLDTLKQHGLDVSGIHVVPGTQDMRTFYAYTDPRTRTDTDPATHFARIGLPLPDDLADYVHSTPGQDDPDEYEPLAVRPDDWPRTFDGACALHLSPISICTHTSLPTRARQSGVTQVTADPGERYMVPRLRPHVEALLQNLDVFLPSEMEVRSLLGEVDLWGAAVEFVRHGPRIVVVKIGDQGALVYEQDSKRHTHVPPYPARVVDVTGAGDSFCGGFMVGLATTGDPIRAALYGTVSASFAIEGYGALYALSQSPIEARRRLAYLEQAMANTKYQISNIT
jgi:sugar/nucleoside kinase (ribokinase family)